MSELCEICSNKCFGVDGYHGNCCTIEDRDWIIGPVSDPHEFLKRLSVKFSRDILWEDVFIDYEEGKVLFPDKLVWCNAGSYPALRVDIGHLRKPCVFYSMMLRACTIHDVRPEICNSYMCSHLKDAQQKLVQIQT